MRYLAVEPAGGVVHRAVGRRGGVWRGSGVSHVAAHAADADAAAAAAAAAAPATSAADPDDVVIAPVHPPCREKDPSLSAREPPGRFSHGPLPHALPPIIPRASPLLRRPRFHVEPRGADVEPISRCGQIRRDRIVARSPVDRPVLAQRRSPLKAIFSRKSTLVRRSFDHQRYNPFVIRFFVGRTRWDARIAAPLEVPLDRK